MAKQHFIVNVNVNVLMTLDDEKMDKKFLEEFSSYMFVVDSLDEMAQHIAYNHVMNGENTFVEGVGDLKEMGVIMSPPLVDTEARTCDESFDGIR